MPYYVIPGNHDTRYTESGGADYRRVFGQDRFRLLMNGYLFVGINTSPMMNGGEGHVSTQDVQWLQRQLKSHGKKNPAFIITHHPLKGGDVSNWFEVTDVARKYNVQGVLSGHYHRNLMDNYDAIPGIINRSMQRGKIGVPAYVIYAMSDSLYMIEKSVGEEAEKWGALALQPRVYTESDSKLKPNFNVNNRYKQVKRDWDIVTGSSIFSSAASSEKLLFYATRSEERRVGKEC